MKRYVPEFLIITGAILLWALPGVVFSQPLKGRVLSSETKTGIGWVNVVIKGKNRGTVSDAGGYFKLISENIDIDDSLRFSMIGYESLSLPVSQFMEGQEKEVYLKPTLYALREVKVMYLKPRKTKLGTEVISNELRSGFGYNDLGSELGVKIFAKRPVRLEDINLNIGVCTYDSVTYRLNIYQSENQTDYKNILTTPIYISFAKDKIEDVISFNLRKYAIVVKGNIIVALELYKDMGEGRLLFRTSFYNGSTFHRKSIEGNWDESSGVIGIYLHGQTNR